MNNIERIEQLHKQRCLPHEEWCRLLSTWTPEDRAVAQHIASEITEAHFGNRIYFRGIIEFSNICKNDCLYCGIRCANKNVFRYRLTESEILECCREGYRLGYRTFVLQSGESPYVVSEAFLNLIRRIRCEYPDCAITLSVGECSRAVYKAMFKAGATRYLLRHETANQAHYEKLHPSSMSFQNRIRCLHDLKDIGFQTGCGMMVGTPFQTPETLAEDMELMTEIQPEMAGIGPFLPQKDTPFASCPAGSQELTLFLLSLTRILLPYAMIPSTTALGTAAQDGRVHGVLAGCNVVMPNLSPENVRKSYMLYDNKVGTELSAERGLQVLREQMESIGREVIVGRGDWADALKADSRIETV